MVHPTNQCVPSLLNYITAPNVIIWTAIYASIGTGVLSDDVALYVKDFNNEIVLQTPDVDVKFLKPQDVTYHQQYFKFKPHDSFGGESEVVVVVVEPTVVEPTVVEAILLELVVVVLLELAMI